MTELQLSLVDPEGSARPFPDDSKASLGRYFVNSLMLESISFKVPGDINGVE